LSTRYFLFPVANFHLRLQVLQSVDEFFEFMKLEASRFHFQLASLEIDLNVEGMLVQGPDPPGPRYADPQSLLHHWQLALKYFQY